MKKSILLILIPIASLAAACNPQVQTQPAFEQVEIGGTVINVEIADDPSERSQGLMHRTSLPEGEGMLFIFDTYGYHPFWMKNTLIPLDIIWIADDTVVYIEHSVPPGKGLFPPSYTPSAPANFVFEVNAGVAEASGWGVGDVVEIAMF